jgi:hypothetical protein
MGAHFETASPDILRGGGFHGQRGNDEGNDFDCSKLASAALTSEHETGKRAFGGRF